MTRAREGTAHGAMGAFAGVEMRPGADLVARGGPLDPELVLDAYRSGIFPWYDAGTPVLWWCPDPRGVLFFDDLHVPRRLERTIRAGRFDVRRDTAFAEVMAGCKEDRADGTWIHSEMQACYRRLHEQGHAHSVEVYLEGELVGGVYGVAFGGVFAAESMFHRARDASKVAFVALVEHLCARRFDLLDVQFLTDHLAQFGCVEVPRGEYLRRVYAAQRSKATF